MKQEMIFHLTDEDSTCIERLYYIYRSCSNLVSILCKDLKDANHNPECVQVLKSACNDCKQSYIELSLAQKILLNDFFDNNIPEQLKYEFNFERQEVKCVYERP